MVRGDRDELVVRARVGDEDAWAELYGDHAERLVVWLGHLPHVDPASDAEDVAAEAWLTASHKIADFSGDRHDFAGWLFGIARNVARNRHRASNRRRTSPEDHAVDGDRFGRVEDPAYGVVADDAARRLIARLPEREAQVVACLDVVGLDVATTRGALGMSAGAVRVAHHRGLRRLRGMLAPVEGRRPSVVSLVAADVTLAGPRDM